MKKILAILLVMFSLVTLYGCSDNELIEEEKLNNITLTQKFNGEVNYTIKKNGYEIEYLKGEESTSYIDAGTTVYKYTTNTKTIVSDDTSTEDVDETVIIDYVESSTDSTIDFSDKFDALLNLSEADLNEKEDGVYEFKELKENEFFIPFIDGDLYIDSLSRLDTAYEYGFISFDSAEIKISNGAPEYIKAILTYSGKTQTLEIVFSDIDNTSVEILKEKATEDDFNNTVTYLDYLEDDACVITLNFKGYGEVKLKMFNDEADTNAINYFVYLLRKGAYKNAKGDSVSTSGIFFADTDKENGLKKSINAPSSSTVSNERGVLSMVLENDDEVYTQQLVLNFSDNSSSYDSTPYVAIAGVTEGFDVLDILASLSEEEIANLEIKVSAKFNGYSYTKPNLVKAEE